MTFSKKVHTALIRVLVALVSTIIFYALALIYENEWIDYTFAILLFLTLLLAVFWLGSAEKEQDTSDKPK